MFGGSHVYTCVNVNIDADMHDPHIWYTHAHLGVDISSRELKPVMDTIVSQLRIMMGLTANEQHLKVAEVLYLSSPEQVSRYVGCHLKAFANVFCLQTVLSMVVIESSGD